MQPTTDLAHCCPHSTNTSDATGDVGCNVPTFGTPCSRCDYRFTLTRRPCSDSDMFIRCLINCRIIIIIIIIKHLYGNSSSCIGCNKCTSRISQVGRNTNKKRLLAPLAALFHPMHSQNGGVARENKI